jgi:hypothetical protein
MKSRELRSSFDDVNANAMESNADIPGDSPQSRTGLSMRGGGTGSLLPEMLDDTSFSSAKSKKANN